MDFGDKGVKDGDPMSILVFFAMIFIMLKWIGTASISPWNVTPFPTTFALAFDSFSFLLVVLLPLVALMLMQTFTQEAKPEDIVKDAGKTSMKILVRIESATTKLKSKSKQSSSV